MVSGSERIDGKQVLPIERKTMTMKNLVPVDELTNYW